MPDTFPLPCTNMPTIQPAIKLVLDAPGEPGRNLQHILP
jgi:hypothetical protein